MKRVAILGATGKLGEQLVSHALEEGYEVNALTLHPRKATRFNERFTLFKGDASTGEGLDDVVEGCPLVVSAMGSRQPVLARSMFNLVEVLKGRHLRVLVFVSRINALATVGVVRGFPAALWRRLHASQLDDLAAAEKVLRDSHLPYLILRPVGLNDGPPSRRPLVVTPVAKPGSVSRTDFARFVVAQLGQPEWLGNDLIVGAPRA